jgi:HK97 gp10 family phage protein
MRLIATVDRGSLGNLDKTIKSIQRAVSGALQDIALTGGLVIETAAKERAPVRTGTLRRSISTKITHSDHSSAVASVGPSVDYGVHVEFGTRHMAAQPYMRPAYEEKKDEAVKVMLDIARETIDEAMLGEINARARRRL